MELISEDIFEKYSKFKILVWTFLKGQFFRLFPKNLFKKKLKVYIEESFDTPFNININNFFRGCVGKISHRWRVKILFAKNCTNWKTLIQFFIFVVGIKLLTETLTYIIANGSTKCLIDTPALTRALMHRCIFGAQILLNYL